MPHQCLNCGHVIDRGSDEILKGCSKCSGKKFMFTSTPLSEEKRESLKRRADKVRDKMIKKADPELLKILKEKGMTQLDGSSLEMDSTLGEDWVRYRPGDLDEGEKIEIDEGSAETSLEIVETDGEKRRSAKDLISEYDRKREKDDKEALALQKGKKKKPSTPKRGPSKKKRPKPEAPRPIGDLEKRDRSEVDVIHIVEQGVYEIDVEKLLDDNPIVIQKDGSYLIHLPSLFKDGRGKKS